MLAPESPRRKIGIDSESSGRNEMLVQPQSLVQAIGSDFSIAATPPNPEPSPAHSR